MAPTTRIEAVMNRRRPLSRARILRSFLQKTGGPVGAFAAAILLLWPVATEAVRAAVPSDTFDNPGDIAVARSGLIYVANNNQILVRHRDGLTRFAGTGKRGNTGDGGPAVDAKVTPPAALALAPNGTIYFASGSLVRDQPVRRALRTPVDSRLRDQR